MDRFKKTHDDLEILVEFAENGDIELNDLTKELDSYVVKIDDLELKLILGNSLDFQNAIISIHPGAGGVQKVKIGFKCCTECIRDGLK